MDNETIKIKQLGLKIFEEILLEKDYSSKSEVLLNAVERAKKSREKSLPKDIILAHNEALKMLQSLSFSDMLEVKELIKSTQGK